MLVNLIMFGLMMVLQPAYVRSTPLRGLFSVLKSVGRGGHLSEALCRRFEDDVLETLVLSANHIKSDYKYIMVQDRMLSVHSLIAHKPGDGRSRKPSILWLHGVGGTATFSFGVSGIIDQLVDQFDIYALDLPGFGRSQAPDALKGASEEQIEAFFHEYISAYLRAQGLADGVDMTIGHSYGGYHALRFAEKSPDMAKKLLLVDPAGLFPTLGKEGAWMAVLFKSRAPMAQLRALGSFGAFIANSIYGLFNATSRSYYWYQVQAAPAAIGDHLVARYVSMARGIWTKPAWRSLVKLSIPCALAYGETDNIMPVHQGIIASSLCGSQVPLYVIKDAWHGPMAIRGGLDFSTLVRQAYETATRSHSDPVNKLLTSMPTKEDNVRSYFSIKKTSENIRRFYEKLLSAYRHASGRGKLRAPALFMIHGQKVVKAPEIPGLWASNFDSKLV
jgi:pimeloyl-ACP methyl ester carboxylesterase